MRILLVVSDRNEGMRLIMRKLLERHGNAVVTTHNVQMAINEMSREEIIELLITELNFPMEEKVSPEGRMSTAVMTEIKCSRRTDGLEILRIAKKKNIPSILMAGSFDEDTLSETARLGVEVVLKPGIFDLLKEKGILKKI